MPENNVKGICFYDFLNIITEGYSEDHIQQVAAALKPDNPALAAEVSEQSFAKGVWYPIEWYRQLHRAAQQALQVNSAFSFSVGHKSTLHDLSHGIYKIFMRISSPQFIMTTGAMLFSKYYELGSMTIRKKETGYAQAECRDCFGFNGDIWQDVRGGIHGSLEAAGGKEIFVRLVSGGKDNHTKAMFEALWKT